MSCLDPSGRAVEWWVVYKLPVIPGSSDAALQAGLGYAYFDASSSAASPVAMATTATPGAGITTVKGARLDDTLRNPLKNTLDQIYDNVGSDATGGQDAGATGDLAYLMYNDELPCSSPKSSAAQCSGDDTEACMATCPFTPYTKYNKIGLGPSDCYSGKYDHSKCNVWYCSIQGTFFAHSKGTLALDSESGFVLTHSLPRFPAPASLGADYRFQGCLGTYGQTFFCTSIPTAAFDQVGAQLRHIGPLVYDKSKAQPTDISSSLDNLQKVFDYFDLPTSTVNKTIFDQNRLRNASALYQSAATLVGTDHTKFLHVATEPTGSTKPHSLWTDAVPRALNVFPSDELRASEEEEEGASEGTSSTEISGLFVETWRKGNGPSNDGKVSVCRGSKSGYDYDVVNVGEVLATSSKTGDATFSFQKDHSKWAVTEGSRSKWLCIGDKNRELSQDKRGGGAMCVENAALHAAFRGAIGVLGGDIWHGTKCSGAGGHCSKKTQTCVKCGDGCPNTQGDWYCDTQDTDCGIKPPGR
jgi:hypothetical protein